MFLADFHVSRKKPKKKKVYHFDNFWENNQFWDLQVYQTPRQKETFEYPKAQHFRVFFIIFEKLQ